MSVSRSDRLPAARECCLAIKQEFGEVFVAIGGQGVASDQQALDVGADAWVTSADHLHEMLQAVRSN
jgi:hypothetical protein